MSPRALSAARVAVVAALSCGAALVGVGAHDATHGRGTSLLVAGLLCVSAGGLWGYALRRWS